MNENKLAELRISDHDRRRSGGGFWPIVLTIFAICAAAAWFAIAKAKPSSVVTEPAKSTTAPAVSKNDAPKPTVAAPPKSDTVLTVSGHIINRERIELSPRFMGQVKWISVKKGDLVKKDQVIVRLDDAEQRARLAEAEGQLAHAQVAIERARLAYTRVQRLRASQNETQEREDEARLAVAAAEAQVRQIEGMRDMARVYLDWCEVRSPIDGVVLEKLSEPGELVTPQSFGGTRGPSTALVALADPNDLQVELDVSESDLAKVTLGQKCRITPEAFADKQYTGSVVEIAPEANRQKGTLMIKVQIERPDRYLTPELMARVDFLP